MNTRTLHAARDSSRFFVAIKRILLWQHWVVAVLVLASLLLPTISRAQGSSAAAKANSSLIIKLAPGLPAQAEAAIVARNGGSKTSSIKALGLHVITVPPGQLDNIHAKYKADPQVARAEVNRTRRAASIPSDPMYASQWALPKIGWDQVFGNVTPPAVASVAILDTGIDATHPDLVGTVVAGTSILDGGNGMTDPNGHGTWLAGIIAAQASATGGQGIAGVGYAGVGVIPVTVLGSDGQGLDSDVIQGVLWAADNHADVILMAFSNPGFSESLQEAIDYAWARGAVLVAAVGNDATSGATFPAGDRGVIGVSATDPTDALAYFSNSGDATFIAAPGTDILTTLSGGGYGNISGTSASAAIVAGSAALLKAIDPTLSNGVVVGRLARSTDAAGTQGQTGNGRLNLARAVADTGTEAIQPAGAAPVGSGGPFVGPYVAAAAHSTTTSVSCVSPILINQTSTCTATVIDSTASGSNNNPGGTVSFTPVGTVSFVGNPCTLSGSGTTSSCTVTTINSVVGTWGVNASYSSANTSKWQNSSAPSSAGIIVNKRASATAVSCTTPITLGATTTCTVTVTDTSPGTTITPNGSTVFFFPSGGALVSSPLTCTLSAGTCQVTVSTVGNAGGTNSVYSQWDGDASHIGSNTNVQVVVLHPTTTTVSCPASASVGQVNGCTVQVTDSNSYPTTPPSGTFTVTASGAGVSPTSASCVLSGSGASTTCSVSFTGNAAGSLTVNAPYPGDGTHAPTSGSASITVTSTFTVSPSSGGNGTVSPSTPQTVTANATTAFTLTPNAGYHIAPVTGSCGGSLSANLFTTAAVTANCSVIANFAINTYTLTYAAGANGTLSGTASQIVNYGANGTPVTAVPNTGYHFVNWSDASTLNSRNDVIVTANVSVTANFAINTYTLTYSAGANGTLTGISPQTVNHGASGSAVTAVLNAGYHFVNWSDGSTANPRADTNVTANLTVTANFAINTYALTYSAGANGTLTGTSPQTVNHGASGTAVTAVASAGYHFVNWSDASTANPRADTNVTANLSVSASFIANPPPAVAANTASLTRGEGKFATNSGTYSDAYAGSVTITASVGSISKTGSSNGSWFWDYLTIDGPAESQTVTITADSGIGAAGISTTTFALTVNNVAPFASFSTNIDTINEGGQIVVSFTAQGDQSSVDTAAGFRYAYACDGSSLATSTYAGSGTAAAVNCPFSDNGAYTIRARIIDKDDGFTEFTKNVTVNDVAPTATFNVQSAADEGAPVSVSFTGQTDPSSVDTTAGFHYAFACDGIAAGLATTYAAAATSASTSCSYNSNGTFTILGRIFDKDNNYTDYSASTTITAHADIGVTVDDGQTTAVIGSTVTYTITVTNHGPDAVTGVTISDNFPATLGTINWTCVASGGSTCPASGSGNINAAMNLANGGTATFTASGTLDLGATGSLINTASLTLPANVVDGNSANNSATDTDTIVKQTQAPVTLSAPASATYAQTGLSAVAAGGSGGGTFSYSAGGSNACSVDSSTGALTITSGTGTCAITATRAGDSLYEAATSAPADVLIGKASSTVTVTCTVSVIYTGVTQTPCTAQATGVGMSPVDVSPSLTYANNTNVGSATANASWAGDANHTGNTGAGGFAITQAVSTTIVSCPAGVTYTGAAQTPCTVAVTGVGGLSLTPTPAYTANVNVGTATASYTYAGDANHSISSDSKTFAITLAPSITTVTCPVSMIYSGVAQTPCTVAVSGVGGLSLTPTPAYTANVNVGTATASYTYGGDANHSSSSHSKTFAITLAPSITVVTCPIGVTYTGAAQTPCTVAITGAGGLSLSPTPSYAANTNVGTATASYTYAGDANHSSSSDSKTFAITLAPSITAVTCPVSVVYSGVAQMPCTVAITGAGGLSLTPSPSFTSNTDAGTATASYAFTGDSNHSGSSDSKTFAITLAPSTTAVTCPVSVIYSGVAQTPCTVAVTGVGGLNLTPPPNYTNNTEVGAATASYTYGGDANHSSSSDSKTFAITLAPSITAVTCPSGVTYTGGPQTPCTVLVTGAGGLSLASSPNYTNNTNAGTATASYTYAGDSNHSGSSGSKTFAINAATSTTVVTCPASVTYTGTAQTPCTVAVTGVGGLNLTPTSNYAANIIVGTATASYTYAGDTNHSTSSDSKTFIISPAISTTVITCPASVTFTGSTLAPCSALVTGAGGLNQALTVSYGNNINVGTATGSASYAGDSNHSGSSDSKTFAINAAISTTVVTCPASAVYTGAAQAPCTVTVTGAGGLSLVPTPIYTNNINVGTATASYTYAGDANHSGSSDSKNFAISQKTLTITAANATKQYSDPLPAFTVTYSGFVPGEGPTNLGGTLACTTTATTTSGPGGYPITCSGATSSNYAIGYVGATLTVTREDARVNYTGTTFTWTASTSSGTASVVLSATVQDITALLGDPAYDATAGDIRNATLKFVNREASDAVLCTASIALVNAADLKTAIATCTWTANIGNADSDSFTVGIIVDAFYTRNARTDDAVVTISKPLATNFITGGGYLVATSAAGLYASDVGSKNNMGFNVKYNKAGTNLQGKVNVIVRKGGRTYQIRSSAIDSLGVTGSNWTTPTACTTASPTTPCMAQFTSKANITDITDPLLPVSVGSGLTLQFGLTDKGEPGSTDMASITVTGGTTLYYSSNWSGSPLKTQDQLLGGGNVVVH